MGSGPSVPDDIRGHIAKYVPDRAPFLALRAASKFEREKRTRGVCERRRFECCNTLLVRSVMECVCPLGQEQLQEQFDRQDSQN